MHQCVFSPLHFLMSKPVFGIKRVAIHTSALFKINLSVDPHYLEVTEITVFAVTYSYTSILKIWVLEIALLECINRVMNDKPITCNLSFVC